MVVLQEHQGDFSQHRAPAESLQCHLRPKRRSEKEARAALLVTWWRSSCLGSSEQGTGPAVAQGIFIHSIKHFMLSWTKAKYKQSNMAEGVPESKDVFLCFGGV